MCAPVQQRLTRFRLGGDAVSLSMAQMLIYFDFLENECIRGHTHTPTSKCTQIYGDFCEMNCLLQSTVAFRTQRARN